jgi:dTDP-4-amino-4,6-dideoxygalactose transaminase
VVSLHATKVLGIGEGGFLATDDQDLARRVRQLTTFGFRGSRESQIPATNAKLSEYAAAIGLAALDAWPHNRLRWMRAAQNLRAAMVHLPQVVFQRGWGLTWATSVCCVNPAFADCPRDDLAQTDRLGGGVIGLPFSIDLDHEQIGRVVAALAKSID